MEQEHAPQQAQQQAQQQQAAAGPCATTTKHKARVLFVVVPMHSHVKPLLEPAAILQAYAVEVAVCSYESRASQVAATGLQFESLGPDELGLLRRHGAAFNDPASAKAAQAAACAMFAGWEVGMHARLLDVLERWQPDLIAADAHTWAALDVAEVQQLPLVLLCSLPLSMALAYTLPLREALQHSDALVPFESPSLCLTEAMDLPEQLVLNPLAKCLLTPRLCMPYWRARNEARRQLGMPPLPRGHGPMQPAHSAPRATIVATSWIVEPRRRLPRNWHLVGAMGCDFTHGVYPPPLSDKAIRGFLDGAHAAAVPAVLVATGSVATLSQGLVREMAAAFAALPAVRFVWGLKQASQELLPPGYKPPNVLITAWVQQPEVLGHPSVRGFVTHGGMNSLNEGLAAGVPMVAMAFAADQKINAWHIADRELGLTLDPARLKAKAMADAIVQLLASTRFARFAAAAGREIRSCSGPALTAWRINDVARMSGHTANDEPDEAAGRQEDEAATARSGRAAGSLGTD